MNTENNNQAVDLSTETKIKNAARVVFHKKGFAATRTRDIAEEANINLALLNYYFRSKEKLFDIVMLETMQGFFRSIADVFNDETTSFEGKIDVLVATYIDLLIANPDIPLFIFHELRTQSGELIEKLGAKQIKRLAVCTWYSTMPVLAAAVVSGSSTPITGNGCLVRTCGV